jgi:hypothetical protein
MPERLGRLAALSERLAELCLLCLGEVLKASQRAVVARVEWAVDVVRDLGYQPGLARIAWK